MTNFNDIFNVNNILNDSSKIGTISDFAKDLVPDLEDILKVQFPGNRYKQQVRVHGDNRISFACPICGDSHNDDFKKRGNIILSGEHRNMFKCFNCGAYMTINRFFTMFNKNLSINSIEYIAEHKNTLNSLHRNNDTSMNLIFNINNIEDVAVSRSELMQKANLIEIEHTEAALYLRKRNQYFAEKFLFDNLNKIIYILNLTPSGKILGFQTRPLYKTNGAKYKTYKLSSIYEMFLNDKKDIISDIDNLSMVFNILLVDPSKPIVVTEGPLDAFLLKNSIAICGANKSLVIPLNYYYLFDDDTTGKEKAIEKISSKEYAFLWDKFKKDIGLPHKSKWDINDVVNYCKENNIKIPNVMNYFSNDYFDMMDI